MPSPATGISPLGPVTLAPVASIRPYPANPRKVPAKAIEQVAESIREFGWQQPLIVDADMVIVAGHTRYEAAKHLGLAEVPVIVAGQLTPAQTRAFRIADNRTHDYTSWDYPQLIAELNGLDEDFAAVLDLADWQTIITGFEASQGADMLPLTDAERSLTSLEHTVTVVFASREAANQAGPDILKLPGVLDVRVSYADR
jgi:ParB/Sulfiredoxin domain